MVSRMANMPPFEEHSDTDSIATNTTTVSETEGKEWHVEKILAEQRVRAEDDDAGQMLYLLKWEGWALGYASWEPRSNIKGDELMTKWSRE